MKKSYPEFKACQQLFEYWRKAKLIAYLEALTFFSHLTFPELSGLKAREIYRCFFDVQDKTRAQQQRNSARLDVDFTKSIQQHQNADK